MNCKLHQRGSLTYILSRAFPIHRQNLCMLQEYNVFCQPQAIWFSICGLSGSSFCGIALGNNWSLFKMKPMLRNNTAPDACYHFSSLTGRLNFVCPQLSHPWIIMAFHLTSSHTASSSSNCWKTTLLAGSLRVWFLYPPKLISCKKNTGESSFNTVFEPPVLLLKAIKRWSSLCFLVSSTSGHNYCLSLMSHHL